MTFRCDRSSLSNSFLSLFLFAFLSFGTSANALVVLDTYTNDFVLLYSAGFYMSIDKHPDFVGVFAAPGLAQMEAGENLVLVAHGSPNNIGGMSGQQLALWLTNNGIPMTPLTVFLASCDSGTDAGQGSVVGNAAKASAQNLTFTGYEGCTVTSQRLQGEDVVNPNDEPELEVEQAALELELNPQAVIAQFVQDYQVSHGGSNPPLALLAQTAFNDSTIQEFFQRLLREGAPFFLPDGEGVNTQQGMQVSGDPVRIRLRKK
jgi:hypothetical protein